MLSKHYEFFFVREKQMKHQLKRKKGCCIQSIVWIQLTLWCALFYVNSCNSEIIFCLCKVCFKSNLTIRELSKTGNSFKIFSVITGLEIKIEVFLQHTGKWIKNFCVLKTLETYPTVNIIIIITIARQLSYNWMVNL